MKEILIKVSVDDATGRIASILKHRGFDEVGDIAQVLMTIGILDNLKQQQLMKLEQKINIKGGAE